MDMEQPLLWGATHPHELLDEGGDVATGDGDARDGAADHVPVGYRDDMCHTLASIDHHSCQRGLQPTGESVGGPLLLATEY